MFIRVVPYDPFWEVEYENESQKIKNILKDILVEVYHIGSTAVKGLAAKSIIDIMPVVTNISLVDKHNKEFVAIGYECMGEFGIEGRRYFRKGGDNRTHQIHIFEQSNHKDINRHIAVRDFLRTHPDIALEYAHECCRCGYARPGGCIQGLGVRGNVLYKIARPIPAPGLRSSRCPVRHGGQN